MWHGHRFLGAPRHFSVREADTSCAMPTPSKAQVCTADGLSFQQPPASSGRAANLEYREQNGLENLP